MKTNKDRRAYFREYKRKQRAKAKGQVTLTLGQRIDRLLTVHPHFASRFESRLSAINQELRAERERIAKEEMLRTGQQQQGGLPQ